MFNFFTLHLYFTQYIYFDFLNRSSYNFLIPFKSPSVNNNFRFMFGFMVFNATFNNISVTSWWSLLLMEETGVPAEKQRPAVSH